MIANSEDNRGYRLQNVTSSAADIGGYSLVNYRGVVINYVRNWPKY